MWKQLRIAILLGVLALVAGTSWLDRQRVRSWQEPLVVGIFPVAADDSPATRDYVAALRPAEFAPVAAFFAEEAQRHQLRQAEPVRIELEPPPADRPPAPAAGAGIPATIWWSLKLRLYAWRHGRVPSGPQPSIRLFVLYHDPGVMPRLPHSAGLKQGMVGVVHLFAAARMRGSNAVVIAHEFLHTVGASDKYHPVTNAPLFPIGYGDPAQTPRFPQRFAEIMAGRRALTPVAQEIPVSLDECVVGSATALEIGWPRR